MSCKTYFTSEYLTALSVLSFIETPFSLVVIYCILLHSPPAMRHFKWLLFVQQVVILSFQVLIANLTKPSLLMPATAVLFWGPINKYVDAKTQLFILLTTFGWLLSFSSTMFEYRHQLLVPKNSALRFSTRTRVVIFFWRIGSSLALGVAFGFFCDDQTRAVADWMKVWMSTIHHPDSLIQKLPCVLMLIGENTLSIFYSIEYFMIELAIFFVITSLLVIEMTFYIFDSLRRLNSDSIGVILSHRTRFMQRSFLHSLILQEITPLFIAYFGPLVYFVTSIFVGYMNIDLNNLFIMVALLHGGAGSVCAIFANRPYRKAVEAAFGCVFEKFRRKKHSATTSSSMLSPVSNAYLPKRETTTAYH